MAFGMIVSPRVVNNFAKIIFIAGSKRPCCLITKINLQIVSNLFHFQSCSTFTKSKMVNLEEVARIGREKHSNNTNVTIQYGTAGFREK